MNMISVLKTTALAGCGIALGGLAGAVLRPELAADCLKISVAGGTIAVASIQAFTGKPKK